MALLCSFFFLLSCLALLTTPHFTYSSSSPTNQSINITIPITHFRSTQNPPPSSSSSSSSPCQELHRLAAASLTRARRLKHHNKTAAAAATTNTTTAPLSGHSYGAYSISLSFGTPPQTLPFLVDTGSDLVWFPCTKHYTCKACSTSLSANPPNIPSFVPKSSSTSKLLGCSNPKCGWIHKSQDTSCKDCPLGTRNCTQICPPYLVLYGSGSTGGLLLSETLTLKHQQVPNFIVGCSLFSAHQPAGIVGFGRGSPSLPSQLGLKKFSTCLLSRRFDDTVETTSLLLEGGAGSGSGEKTDGVSYTSFIRNPDAYAAYYYVGLRKITVGGQRVKIPYRHLAPGRGGDGGTIVDSGTAFTYMARELFEAVSAEFAGRVRGYARERRMEALTGLRPCFNVSGGEGRSLPEMSLYFKGGAEMRLPAANYFSYVGGRDRGRGEAAMCLTIVTDMAPAGAGGDGRGPSIILGNFQMQNFYVEYDLRNERFGFRPQQCN